MRFYPQPICNISFPLSFFPVFFVPLNKQLYRIPSGILFFKCLFQKKWKMEKMSSISPTFWNIFHFFSFFLFYSIKDCIVYPLASFFFECLFKKLEMVKMRFYPQPICNISFPYPFFPVFSVPFNKELYRLPSGILIFNHLFKKNSNEELDSTSWFQLTNEGKFFTLLFHFVPISSEMDKESEKSNRKWTTASDHLSSASRVFPITFMLDDLSNIIDWKMTSYNHWWDPIYSFGRSWKWCISIHSQYWVLGGLNPRIGTLRNLSQILWKHI